MLGHCLAGRKEKEKQAFCVSLPRGPRTGANSEPPIGMISTLARKGKAGPREKKQRRENLGRSRGEGNRLAASRKRKRKSGLELVAHAGKERKPA